MTSSQLKDYSQSVNPNLHSTGAESKSLYNTYNVEPLSLTKYAYFEKYANSIKEHYTKEIGEPKHKDPQEYDRSTFTSVIDYIEVNIIFIKLYLYFNIYYLPYLFLL